MNEVKANFSTTKDQIVTKANKLKTDLDNFKKYSQKGDDLNEAEKEVIDLIDDLVVDSEAFFSSGKDIDLLRDLTKLMNNNVLQSDQDLANQIEDFLKQVVEYNSTLLDIDQEYDPEQDDDSDQEPILPNDTRVEQDQPTNPQADETDDLPNDDELTTIAQDEQKTETELQTPDQLYDRANQLLKKITDDLIRNNVLKPERTKNLRDQLIDLLSAGQVSPETITTLENFVVFVRSILNIDPESQFTDIINEIDDINDELRAQTTTSETEASKNEKKSGGFLQRFALFLREIFNRSPKPQLPDVTGASLGEEFSRLRDTVAQTPPTPDVPPTPPIPPTEPAAPDEDVPEDSDDDPFGEAAEFDLENHQQNKKKETALNLREFMQNLLEKYSETSLNSVIPNILNALENAENGEILAPINVVTTLELLLSSSELTDEEKEKLEDLISDVKSFFKVTKSKVEETTKQPSQFLESFGRLNQAMDNLEKEGRLEEAIISLYTSRNDAYSDPILSELFTFFKEQQENENPDFKIVYNMLKKYLRKVLHDQSLTDQQKSECFEAVREFLTDSESDPDLEFPTFSNFKELWVREKKPGCLSFVNKIREEIFKRKDMIAQAVVIGGLAQVAPIAALGVLAGRLGFVMYNRIRAGNQDAAVGNNQALTDLLHDNLSRRIGLRNLDNGRQIGQIEVTDQELKKAYQDQAIFILDTVLMKLRDSDLDETQKNQVADLLQNLSQLNVLSDSETTNIQSLLRSDGEIPRDLVVTLILARGGLRTNINNLSVNNTHLDTMLMTAKMAENLRSGRIFTSNQTSKDQWWQGSLKVVGGGLNIVNNTLGVFENSAWKIATKLRHKHRFVTTFVKDNSVNLNLQANGVVDKLQEILAKQNTDITTFVDTIYELLAYLEDLSHTGYQTVPDYLESKKSKQSSYLNADQMDTLHKGVISFLENNSMLRDKLKNLNQGKRRDALLSVINGKRQEFSRNRLSRMYNRGAVADIVVNSLKSLTLYGLLQGAVGRQPEAASVDNSGVRVTGEVVELSPEDMEQRILEAARNRVTEPDIDIEPVEFRGFEGSQIPPDLQDRIDAANNQARATAPSTTRPITPRFGRSVVPTTPVAPEIVPASSAPVGIDTVRQVSGAADINDWTASHYDTFVQNRLHERVWLDETIPFSVDGQLVTGYTAALREVFGTDAIETVTDMIADRAGLSLSYAEVRELTKVSLGIGRTLTEQEAGQIATLLRQQPDLFTGIGGLGYGQREQILDALLVKPSGADQTILENLGIDVRTVSRRNLTAMYQPPEVVVAPPTPPTPTEGVSGVPDSTVAETTAPQTDATFSGPTREISNFSPRVDVNPREITDIQELPFLKNDESLNAAYRSLNRSMMQDALSVGKVWPKGTLPLIVDSRPPSGIADILRASFDSVNVEVVVEKMLSQNNILFPTQRQIDAIRSMSLALGRTLTQNEMLDLAELASRGEYAVLFDQMGDVNDYQELLRMASTPNNGYSSLIETLQTDPRTILSVEYNDAYLRSIGIEGSGINTLETIAAVEAEPDIILPGSADQFFPPAQAEKLEQVGDTVAQSAAEQVEASTDAEATIPQRSAQSGVPQGEGVL